MLRVLASVGTQMAAFVHEINNILGMAKTLGAAVVEIERELSLSAAQRKKLCPVAIRDRRSTTRNRTSSILSDRGHFTGRSSASFPAETCRAL